MAEAIAIAAEARDRAGKGAARSARRAGKIPSVIYGDAKPPVLINLDRLEINRLIKDPAFTTHLYDVVVGDAHHRVLARDVQLDPVTDDVLHVDFLRVGMATTISMGVPVQFINERASPGLKRGGVLNVVRYEIELVCRADSIPDQIVVDLTGSDIGDSIHISSVTLPEGTQPAITDRDFTVATIAAPSGLKSETPEEEADEPEAPTE